MRFWVGAGATRPFVCVGWVRCDWTNSVYACSAWISATVLDRGLAARFDCLAVRGSKAVSCAWSFDLICAFVASSAGGDASLLGLLVIAGIFGTKLPGTPAPAPRLAAPGSPEDPGEIWRGGSGWGFNSTLLAGLSMPLL